MGDPLQNLATATWHAAPAEHCLVLLESRLSGLTQAEADARLAQVGPNRLPLDKPRSAWARFADQFKNVLIYVLIAAGLGTLVLGHHLDSAVIFGVVLINAAIGFLQEGKAESALAALRELLSPQASVQRDAKRTTVDAEALVPGDIVHLASGDRVPADLRLLRTHGLMLNEAALTGESLPIEKHPNSVASDAALGDRSCMAYSGTFVLRGAGLGVVVATGPATEIGHIGRLLARVERLSTPLIRQMSAFARMLTGAILVVATATLIFGLAFRDYTVTEMFLAAVGLSVAAIPEGLPAIMTITLAIGVRRMAARNAIIRRLPAVETLGSVGVVCSDKTGTLTRNEMTARSLITSDAEYHIGGNGYAPDGDIERDGLSINPLENPTFEHIARAAALCSDAELRHIDGAWDCDGDPTEGALLALAEKLGAEPSELKDAWPRHDCIPFESEHRFMATLHHDHAGRHLIIVKGAPEVILDRCTREHTDTTSQLIDPSRWQQSAEAMAARGERVLALAYKEGPGDATELTFDDVATDLTLLAIIGITDPPRPEAVEAIRRCQDAGIAVKMITGDHAATASAVARELGLSGESAMTGAEIDAVGPQALASRLEDTAVFARTSPEHKLALVESLQAQGSVVAMTGDGVNDAPALKRADVGVAMGIKGSEAAKEAAEMVLADDNFASIVHAIEEGRIVYDNLKKAIVFILPTNGAEALVIITAIAMGTVLPITAVQILWINMITAVTLALALSFEQAEQDVMQRPPRRSDEPLLSKFLIWRIIFVSLVLVGGTQMLFNHAIDAGLSLDEARTVAVNALVVFEIFYLFNTRRLSAPALTGGDAVPGPAPWIAVGLVLSAQLGFTYLPWVQTLMGSAAISGSAWIQIGIVGGLAFLVIEFEKAVIRRWKHRRAA